MKRLFILTEVFYPEETATAHILTKIANYLADKVEVNVICGPISYEDSDRLERKSGLNERVKVMRVSDTKLNKNKILSRILRFCILTYRLTRSLMKNLQNGDEMLVVTNPAPLLLAVSKIRKIKGNKLHLLVHDVFPENTVPAGIIKSENSSFYKMLKSSFDKAYSAADTLIVLGRDMKDVVEKKIASHTSDTNVVIIENWADVESINPQPSYDNEGIRFQYAGNLGRVQGLMELLKCFKDANDNKLSLDLYGSGAIKDNMVKYVSDNQLDNVTFYGSYKRDEQNEILNKCDIAIITLANGMYGLGVPSKTYNILAAGKPILFIGDLNSEVALLIKDHKIGFAFSPHDTEGITNFFSKVTTINRDELHLMGKKARELAEKFYSEDVILNKYLDIFA